MLLLLTTTAQAAPLYLSCKGEWQLRDGKPEPAVTSIIVDGTNVKVEGQASVPITHNEDDVWTFGDMAKVTWGQINRINGQTIIISKWGTISMTFAGVCNKTEKLF